MNTRWSDCFLLVGVTQQEDNSNPYRKTTRADLMLWEGSFEGHLMCVHSTEDGAPDGPRKVIPAGVARTVPELLKVVGMRP